MDRGFVTMNEHQATLWNQAVKDGYQVCTDQEAFESRSCQVQIHIILPQPASAK